MKKILSEAKRAELIPQVLDALLDFHLNLLRRLQNKRNEAAVVDSISQIVYSEVCLLMDQRRLFCGQIVIFEWSFCCCVATAHCTFAKFFKASNSVRRALSLHFTYFIVLLAFPLFRNTHCVAADSRFIACCS